jgi:beta-N-acetylhexosaminidase
VAAAEELRVLTGPPASPGAVRPEDLPLEAQALAVLCAGEEAGWEERTDELVAAGLGAVVFAPSALQDPAAAARRVAALAAGAARSPVGAPLLIGVEHEGGRACALPSGPTTLPAALALGAVGEEGLARTAGRATAGQLRAVGICWDLAPVCNLEPVLGSRRLSGDPEAAARLAAAFVEGLQAGGVLACAKYFPVPAGTPVPEPSVWRRGPGSVFAAAVQAGAATLLVGHGTFPGAGPASLTPLGYRLAREALGFEGLLVTDALDAEVCLRFGGDVGEAAVRALVAGADLVWVRGGPEAQRQAWRAVVAAAAADRLPRPRLAEAVGRVLACKRTWGLARRTPPDEAAVPHLLARPSDRELASHIAARAVTELAPGPAVPAVGLVRYGPGAAAELVEAAAARWPAAPLRPDGLAGWVSLMAAEGGSLCHLAVGPPLPAQRPAGRLLLAYDTTPASVRALLACAAGEAPALGRLPLAEPDR